MAQTYIHGEGDEALQIRGDEREYWAIVAAAYEVSHEEGFEVGRFVSQTYLAFKLADTQEDRLNISLQTSEVLGGTLNTVDHPNRVGEYVRYKRDLAALTDEERAFCRLAIRTAEPYCMKYYARTLDKEDRNGNVAEALITSSQLMALLS